MRSRSNILDNTDRSFLLSNLEGLQVSVSRPSQLEPRMVIENPLLTAATADVDPFVVPTCFFSSQALFGPFFCQPRFRKRSRIPQGVSKRCALSVTIAIGNVGLKAKLFAGDGGLSVDVAIRAAVPLAVGPLRTSWTN